MLQIDMQENQISENSNDIVEQLNSRRIKKTLTVIERTNDNELGFRIITSYPAFYQEERMKFSNIIYFCDCYLIMLDYEEELVDIIGDFRKKETNEKIIKLKNECKQVLSLDESIKVEVTKNIMLNCADLDIESDEILEILECIYNKL